MTISGRFRDKDSFTPRAVLRARLAHCAGRPDPLAHRAVVGLKMVFTSLRGYEEAGVVREGWEVLTNPVKV